MARDCLFPKYKDIRLKKRIWLLSHVDIEEDVTTGDRVPLDEPVTLGCTFSHEVAERMMGVLVSAQQTDSRTNMVRSTIEVLPAEIQEVLEPKGERTLLDEILDNDKH